MSQQIKVFENNSGTNSATGIDLGTQLVDKEYLLDVYPNLVPWMKAPGLWTWGYDNYGQLGDTSVVNKSSPIQTVAGGTNWKQVAGGYDHTTAIKF